MATAQRRPIADSVRPPGIDPLRPTVSVEAGQSHSSDVTDSEIRSVAEAIAGVGDPCDRKGSAIAGSVC